MEAFNKSLEKLNTDYLDLYLIHWPAKGYTDAWKVLEELYDKKKIRAIGVSNFNRCHLDEIDKIATIKPMVNQIESNPHFNNQQLIDYCHKENIVTEAWSPLGGSRNPLVSLPALIEIGKKYNKSAAQVIIRWNIQRNVVVLPKSVNEQRIKSNIDVFDFALSVEEMNAINNLNTNTRTGPDPENFNF